MSVFEADAEGWRQINAGRPAYELVREAVQNSLDEPGCTSIEVEVEYKDGGVDWSITDDVPGGIRDERLIWTIWMSDKSDSPTKRGRMGRGLKELISVSNWSLVVSAGVPAVEFHRYRGKWARTSPKKHRTAKGTVIEGRTTLWKASDAKEIVEYLRRIRRPKDVLLTVNGELVEWRPAAENYLIKLPTVVFETQEDGSRAERNPRNACLVEILKAGGQDGPAWIYEMGIPVEPIDLPFSIDVNQRIPLREKRDTLTDSYRRELYAKLLDARNLAGKVKDEELRDNHAIIATQAAEHLGEATKRRIANAWTGGAAYATTPEVMRAATGQHVQAVPLRKMPEGVRGIVREVGQDAKVVLEQRALAACSLIPAHERTAGMNRLIAVWQWIAAGIRRSCNVSLCYGRPSAAASFNRASRTLTIYVENVPGAVENPLAASSLALLIHELAHWTSQENEHGFGFHSDAEKVGGLVAAFLFEHFAEVPA